MFKFDSKSLYLLLQCTKKIIFIEGATSLLATASSLFQKSSVTDRRSRRSRHRRSRSRLRSSSHLTLVEDMENPSLPDNRDLPPPYSLWISIQDCLKLYIYRDLFYSSKWLMLQFWDASILTSCGLGWKIHFHHFKTIYLIETKRNLFLFRRTGCK